MGLLTFLIGVFIVSFSGAMQPGPVTASVITMGLRNRWAGTLLAIGHGIVEFPLILVIVIGMGKYFELAGVQITIGLAGGMVLIMMAIQTFLSLGAEKPGESKTFKDKPILAGIILTASNPYFLLWWATVGLSFAQEAGQWGIQAFILFAIVHWSVDLIWLQLLSFSSFKGSTIIGQKGLKTVLAFCSLALLGFGLFFIIKAIATIVRISVS